MQIAVIDPQEITITPLFKMMEVENIPKSETAGFAVMEMHEVVEVRFAGSKNYAPIFPADAMWKREGNQVMTYAERWPEQYRAFKEGNPQEAAGTPLQMLRPLGVTPEQLSLCRALKIYSIEALDALTGPAVKTLGVHSNSLKAAASRYLAEHNQVNQQSHEIAALKAEIAALKAGMVIPEAQATPEQIDAAERAADASFADKSDEELKSEIARLAGSRPRGNPNRATLESMLTDLQQAA